MRTSKLFPTLVVLALSLGSLLFASAPALAARGYAFSTSFGAGQATGSLAVDDSTNPADPSAGDVYVTDGNVVNKFTAAHAAEGVDTPDGQLTGFSNDFVFDVAVDPANGDVYVTEHTGAVRKFTPEGTEIPFSLEGVSLPFGPQTVAVNPTNGNVYVGEANGPSIYEFSSSGAYTGQAYELLDAGALSLAVDSSGDVYVTDSGRGTFEFSASCASPCSTSQLIGSAGNGVGKADGVAIDPSTQDVFVAYDEFLAEYKPDGQQVGLRFGQGLAGGGGIGLNRAGDALYALDGQAGDVGLFAAGSTPAEPVIAEAATGVTATTATLNGELAGGETGYYFAYNIGATCTGGATTTPAAATGKVKVSAEVTGLQPDVQYAFCLVATNKYGQTEGANTFPTPPAAPSVDGESASSIAQTTATLEALVNPNNQQTTCLRFEYIDDAGYQAAIAAAAANPYGAGASVPCEASSLGAAYGDQRALAKLKGLAPATTYHFRVLVSNVTSPGGETDGPDAEFKTQQPAPAVATGAELSVTQTTARITGTVDPELLATTYFYQYGPTVLYGPVSSLLPAGEGAGGVPAPAFLGSLVPGTTYHYRLVAINEDGTSYGEDHQFTTLAYQPPGVVTGAASVGSPNAATLSGTVDPQGIPTTYEFQIGTDTSYGARVFAKAGESSESQAETLPIAGLQPGTVYHYRICATNEANAGNPACGADATFTTPAVPSALLQPITLPFVATPTIAFPKVAVPTTPKSLTNAQKLKNALRACGKKPKQQRSGCEKTARKKFAPKKQPKRK